MLKAIGNNIIVKLMFKEVSGPIILINEIDKQECLGIVVSPGKRTDIKPDDIIMFEKGQGLKFVHEGIEYMILKDKWVKGIADNPSEIVIGEDGIDRQLNDIENNNNGIKEGAKQEAGREAARIAKDTIPFYTGKRRHF